MDEKKIAQGIAILELILKYGLPLTLKLMAELGNDDPTADEIRVLKNRVPHPDTLEG